MSLPDSVVDSLLEHSPLIEERIISTLSMSKQEKLQSAMLYLLESGGKRLRASLPYLVGELLGNPLNSHYDVGAAIEIIHNFTLIHDDIMDNDSMRRGRPSVHKAFDVPTAINAGDAMLAVAFELISSSSDIEVEKLPELVKIIGGMVRNVSEGQQLDIDNENRRDISIDNYLHMIEGKTAVMFEACARCGAILSDASEEETELLGKWGLNLGLCFQLMDDFIDITGDTKTLGKPAGSDIIQGKRTLIAIHAMDSKMNLINFQSIFGNGPCEDYELQAAIKDLEESGSIEYARKKAMYHHSIAHQCLDNLENNPQVDVLRELTDFQLIRIS